MIPKIHFRMEDHEYLINFIRPDNFMPFIDLSNASFSFPLHKDIKKYCSSKSKDNYNLNVLSIGLTSSPRIFTKIIKPVISHLRFKNIKVSSYSDDIFICAQSEDILKSC